MSNNKGKCEVLVQDMMKAQVSIKQDHQHAGASCLIFLERDDEKSAYIIPCIEEPEDMKKLADALEKVAEQLHMLADKTEMTAKAPAKKDLH